MATTNTASSPSVNTQPQQPQPQPVTGGQQAQTSTPTATPTATPTPTSSATTTSTTKPQLTEERVSEIGWFFIKSYYDFFLSKLDEIHKIYHPQACISHDAFPETDSLSSLNEFNGKVPIAYKARGMDAIKETYAKYLSGSKNNRIVITSACFQLSLNQNIIIVVFGEWSTNDQPYKQFTQTFVLVPGKHETNYEVANDILRFVIINGYKEKNEQVQEKEIKAEAVTKKVAAPVATPEQEPVKEKEAEPVSNNVKPVQKETPPVATATTVSNPVANGSKAEAKKEPVAPVPEAKKPEEKPVSKPEPVKEEKPDVFEPKKEEQEEEVKEESKVEAPVEESKPEEVKEQVNEELKKESAKPSPSQPMSWAALAQQAVPVKQGTKPISSPPITKAPTAAKKPVSSASSASTTSAQSNGKHYKKDDWYPIYIRGIRHLDEQELKDHLSKKFGELKYFKVNENICLADFVNQDAQRRALEAKETTLNGISISLEPRESKTGNSYHGTSGNNGSYKKFGGQGKTGAKNKEKFENKKVNGAKKNVNKPVAK